MKTIDTHNKTVDDYNHEAEEALAFVKGEVKSSHEPIAANDNQQLSFEFMDMAEAAVAMLEAQRKGVSA